MNRVGEIDRRGASRQGPHRALRGEAVDLFGIEVELEGSQELLGVLHVFEQLPEPGEGLIVFRGLLAFLVFPVRGDAFLGDPVHFFGADLHFEGHAVIAHQGGVERAIAVRPRLAVDLNDLLRQIDYPVLQHAGRAIESRFYTTIIRKCRVRHFNQQQNVFRAGVPPAIEVVLRPEQGNVGLS